MGRLLLPNYLAHRRVLYPRRMAAFARDVEAISVSEIRGTRPPCTI